MPDYEILGDEDEFWNLHPDAFDALLGRWLEKQKITAQIRSMVGQGLGLKGERGADLTVEYFMPKPAGSSTGAITPEEKMRKAEREATNLFNSLKGRSK